ncbi:MAG: amidophosphoribosyltransferase [Leptospiraceae bacterium]|nr:MAG: amidophosphoribosyltransferase [Leptospiraceae bacterium]
MIDFLFPNYCIFCNKESKEVLCFECWKKFKTYSLRNQNTKRCKKCFHPLKQNQCLFCSSRYLYFDHLIALYEYNSFTKSLLLDWKYSNNNIVYRIFLKDILKIIKEYKPDRIGYITSSKFGKNYRSYDVLETLVKKIHKTTGIPCGKDIKKIKSNKQSQGKQNERFFNILFSFGLTVKLNVINKYLLIEDTITTGATVNEVARILKQEGIKEVLILSIFMEDIEEESLWNQ